MAFDSLLGNIPLGELGPSGWQGRIKEGAYTSPLGVRVPFDYVEVSRETPLRRAAFSFHGLDNDYIQDNGYGSRSYPLVCYFHGRDHDKIASSFEVALLDKGVGQLEHPLYGTFDVIPTGSITRRNDLVTGNNVSVVEVTFSTTLPSVYPKGQSFPVNEILASIDGFDLAAALAFEDATLLNTVARKADFKNTIRDVLGEIQGAFSFAQGLTAAARREMEDQQRLINEGIDTFVGAPILLAQAIKGLIVAPANMLQGIKDRLAGYQRMLDNILGSHSSTSGDTSPLPETVVSKKNEQALADFVVLTAVSGSVRAAVTSAEFRSRADAIRAAEELLEQLEEAVVFREERQRSLGLIDTGDSYQPLQEAVAKAAGYLVESSFELIPERAIVLDRDRTILDLCGQLYGSVSDERLDFLISSNDLSGNQLLELRRGDRILYYI